MRVFVAPLHKPATINATVGGRAKRGLAAALPSGEPIKIPPASSRAVDLCSWSMAARAARRGQLCVSH
eukprot:2952102-Prymnesium_polylepis.1